MERQRLNPQPTPESSSSDEMRALDGRITAALERAPHPSIPADFAARVAARLPVVGARATTYLPSSRVGIAASIAGLLLLLAGMLLLAPRTTGHDVYWMGLEWTLAAQFCVLAVWLTLCHREVE